MISIAQCSAGYLLQFHGDGGNIGRHCQLVDRHCGQTSELSAVDIHHVPPPVAGQLVRNDIHRRRRGRNGTLI